MLLKGFQYEIENILDNASKFSNKRWLLMLELKFSIILIKIPKITIGGCSVLFTLGYIGASDRQKAITRCGNITIDQ